MMKTRFPFRLLAGIFGVLFLVFLIRRAGPQIYSRASPHSDGGSAW